MTDKSGLKKQIASLVEGAQKFKEEHGSCRVTVGPNAPVAKAGIERISGFWIEVEHDLRLVSRDPDVEDIVVDGPLVYYRAVEGDLTAKDILQSVGWLDAFGSEIEFNSADWSGDSTVHLEGRADGNLLVDATFVLAHFNIQKDWDSDWDDDDA